MTTGTSDTWILRPLDSGTNKKAYKSLGDFSKIPDHQRFDAAVLEAEKLVEHIGKGGISAPKTIRDVYNNHTAHLRPRSH